MKFKFFLLLLFLIGLGFVVSSQIFTKKQSSSVLINPINFYPSKTIPSPSTNPSTITIGLMGDLGLGRYITSTARTKNDFSWSFTGVSSVLQKNDFNLANLESPIIENCPTGDINTFTFCGDTRFLPQLKLNKFILNLANNHMFNYGQDGFTQTKKYLSQNQIDYFYSHASDTEFVKKEINGIKFGFLGYDFITNPKLNPKEVIDTVKKYNSQVDWLIVSLHWGNEYLPKPESWRVEFAHQLIDAGADIIHGHHPHVLQSVEIYKNKPIFYSLGNFIFDQNWSKETSTSEIVNLTLSKDKILKTEKLPIIIKYSSRPEFITN
jgi:poly-gamma-glutamate synthesis protein (capsule biosynthesis protein)